MKNLRSSLCVCLLIVQALVLSVPAFAADSEPFLPSNVIVEDGARDVPLSVITDLSEAYPDAFVTITDWSSGDELPQPRISWYEITEKKQIATHVPVADRFVLSVARGQTKTLSSKWESSLSATCTIKDAISSLNLNRTITKTYTTTDVFTGPDASSAYNSREYRVKFYEDQGTFKGYLHTDRPDSVAVSGKWTSPNSYAAYSVDKKI